MNVDDPEVVDLADESSWLYCRDPECTATHVDLSKLPPVEFIEEMP